MSKEIEKEEKEVKENKDSLPKEKQSRIKGLATFFKVIAKIAKVLFIIAIVGLVLAMIAIPPVLGNIKVTNNEITVFDKPISFEDNNGVLEIVIDGNKVGTIADGNKAVYNQLVARLDGYNQAKLLLYLELSMVLGISIFVINIIIANKAIKLFNNIHDKDTPFIEENSEYLHSIAKLLLISFIIAFCGEFILSIIYNVDSTLHTEVAGLGTILILYMASYIFDYAVILQNKSKLKMYEE